MLRAPFPTPSAVALLVLTAGTLLIACGDKDDSSISSGGLNPGGSDGGEVESGEPELPEDLGYELNGQWVRLDADYEGLYGAPPAFNCATTANGLFEVEGSVVLADEDEGFRAARLYFDGEPEVCEVFSFAEPLSFNASGLPTALAEGTAALVIIRGSGPDALSWTSVEPGDEATSVIAIELLNGATVPRYRWLDAPLVSDDDGEDGVSEGGHLRCG